MGKCKCKMKPRIVSSVVESMTRDKGCCKDVCTTPICGEPDTLNLFAPVIYDQIGINLCATFSLEADIEDRYPTAAGATVSVLGASYEYGEENVQIKAIPGRPNCYAVTLANIAITFAMGIYDANCNLLDTIFPTVLYLPSCEKDCTYDEDTNSGPIQLEIFAPYGVAYCGSNPVIDFIGMEECNHSLCQGINMYGYAKVLDFDRNCSEATVGLTLVLQSMYYAGYKVESLGKISTPKGSIISEESSECLDFVAGDLLNLAIKPLDLDLPYSQKNDCTVKEKCDKCKECKKSEESKKHKESDKSEEWGTPNGCAK